MARYVKTLPERLIERKSFEITRRIDISGDVKGCQEKGGLAEEPVCCEPVSACGK
jgi:hypothetical protein